MEEGSHQGLPHLCARGGCGCCQISQTTRGCRRPPGNNSHPGIGGLGQWVRTGVRRIQLFAPSPQTRCRKCFPLSLASSWQWGGWARFLQEPWGTGRRNGRHHWEWGGLWPGGHHTPHWKYLSPAFCQTRLFNKAQPPFCSSVVGTGPRSRGEGQPSVFLPLY